MIEQVLALLFRKLEDFRHHDTLRGARPDAERAIAALRHVDVKLRHPQRFLLRVSRRDTEIFSGHRFYGVDMNAIDRTGARAFIAPDTIVHVDIQPVARPLGQNILVLRLRIPARYFPSRKMTQYDRKTLHGRRERARNISEVFSHYY
jgi:hypothetical protein